MINFDEYTQKCIMVSIRHLTSRDIELLNEGTEIFAFPYMQLGDDNEFMIWVFDDNELDEILASLEEAGYSNGFKTTIYPLPGCIRDLPVAVQDYLGRVGIVADIVYWEDAKFFELYNGGSWEGLVLDGINAYPNWNESLWFWFTNEPNVFVKKANSPELYAAITESLSSLTPDVSLMKKATDMIYDMCVMIPVSNCGMSYAEAPYVMDSGAMTLDFGFYFYPENIWLNK